MEVEKKPLTELKVVDLKRELEKRGLDKNGVKLVLVERLSKALVDEGLSPDTHQFELPTGKATCKGDESMNADEKVGNEESLDDRGDHSEDASQEITTSKKEAESTQDQVEEAKQAEQDDEEEDNDNPNSTHEDINGFDSLEQHLQDNDYLNSTHEDNLAVLSEDLGQLNEVDLQNEITNDVADDNTVDSTFKEQDEVGNTTGEEFIVKDQISDDDDKNKDSEQTAKKDEKEVGAGDSNKVHDEAEGEGNAAADETQEADTKQDGDKKKEEGDAPEKSGPDEISEGSKEGLEGKCPGANLWVSNLSTSTKATDLKKLFSRHGKLVGAKIVTSARTPGSRCYGYVTMSNTDDADRCIQFLHRVELHGRMISVERAKDDATGPLRSSRKERTRSPRREADTTKGAAESSQKPKSESQSRSRPRSAGRRTPPGNVLSFAKIKRERERQRGREIERRERELAKRRREQAEEQRIRERERRQREEASRLDREKQRLRMEREKLEREKEELLRMERERQRLESDRIAREREELRKRKMELTPSGKRSNEDKRQDYPSKRPNLDKDSMLDPPPAPRFTDSERQRDRYRGSDRRIDDRRSGKDSSRYDMSKGSCSYQKPIFRPHSAWYDQECDDALRRKNDARKAYKQRLSPEKYNLYVKLRTVANHICRRKKRVWLVKQDQEGTLEPTEELWVGEGTNDSKTWSNNGTQQYKSYSGSSGGGYNREVWSTRNSHWGNQDPNSRRDGDAGGRTSYMGGVYTGNQYNTQPPPPGVESHARYQDPRFDGYSHSLPVRKY